MTTQFRRIRLPRNLSLAPETNAVLDALPRGKRTLFVDDAVQAWAKVKGLWPPPPSDAAPPPDET